MEDITDSSSFYLIGNIPGSFHSADLRSFFSRLVEAGSFVCFHYKHRPEHATPSLASKDDESPSTNTSTSDGPSTVMGTIDRTVSTKCCVVVLERGGERDKSLRSYSNKNWVDSNGDSMPLRVRVQKLTVTGTDSRPSNNSMESGEYMGDLCKYLLWSSG